MFSLAWASSVPAAAPAEGVPAKITVDRIELTGVNAFSQAQIENALELGPGDRYEPSKVLRTAANLQTLYRVHGYELVKIHSRLFRKKEGKDSFEDILEFNVEEGDPTRIAKVLIIPEGILNLPGRNYWEEQISKLTTRIGIFPGDVLDQEKMGASKRILQDLLASREYVGAQADDVRFETAPAPSNMESVKAQRWVNLEFHVRPGDRVGFGFRGNSIFSGTQLLALVDDQRVLGLGKDYVVSIRTRIEAEYKALGYGLVNIRTYTTENPSQQERHVTYEIQEGPRLNLDSVEFDGNEAFSTVQLRELFFSKASSVIRQGYYSEEEARKAAEFVIEWMKSKGYLSAKLVAINSSLIPRRKAGKLFSKVKVVIYVYEWDQTKVRKLEIKGMNAISSEEIRKTLGIREGEALSLGAFSEGIDALKALYRSRGFLGMKILNEEQSDQIVKYTDENRIADIILDLWEGPRYRASKILIEGLTFTQEYVIRRELPLREGDLLEEAKLTEAEARLRRLGIFSSVGVKLIDDPDREGFKILRISLQEGTPGVINGGIGFRNDLGVRVFSGIAYTNLWGKNHTLAFDVNVNRRMDETYRFAEFQTQLAYVWPWFLEEDLTFRPNFTVSGHEYKLFDAISASVAATWERKFLAHLLGTFSYTLERVKQFNANTYVDDNLLVTIGALTSTLRLDYRDNPLAPTSGFFGMGSFEYGAPWLLSQEEGYPVQYFRTQFRGDYFVPLAREVTWYLSLRTGFAKNLETPQIDPATGEVAPLSGSIPQIKQFTLGGAGSLRGFTEQALYFQGTTIHGTQSYINYRTQLDLPISGNLRFGPFFDAANLQVNAFSFGNLRYGAGVGFHYQTPIGPVNMDIGFNLDPRFVDGKQEDRSVLYFTIGVI